MYKVLPNSHNHFNLNTITPGSIRNSFLSRPPLNTLNARDSYSLTSTNPNNFQTNTSLNATNMNPQTLYQPHTTPLQQMYQPNYSALQTSNTSTGQNIPIPVATTQNYTVPFVSMNKSVKPFDGLDHQYTPEEYLQQIDAHIIFTMGEQPTDPVAFNQWHKRKMAYIQCSLSGIALSWFLRLHESYKNDWSAFVSAFKKQFSSQKTAYYAQVEAQALTKKDTENVRHYALKVQQLVEKGWYNESAATINLKCNEIFTRGLPKKLKDFAHKRQVKHTSTVLEPSILFHTLVKLVDAEDITNEKIRTLDLPLEVNSLTSKLSSHNLNSENVTPEVMFTQNNDPNNKSKPQFGNTVIIVINQTIPFQTVFENNVKTKNEKEIHIQDQNLLQNHLINILKLIKIKFIQMNNPHHIQ